jgi:hypothetical protein
VGPNTTRGFSAVVVSDMLTVWRRLHLEVDGMRPPVSMPEPDRIVRFLRLTEYDVVKQAYRLHLNSPIDIARYVGGTIRVAGQTAHILDHEESGNVLIVRGLPAGTTSLPPGEIEIFDDDGKWLAEMQWGGLFNLDEAAEEIVEKLNVAFRPAFVELASANALGLNTRPKIDFVQNGEEDDNYEASMDLETSIMFWTHTIVFGCQSNDDSDLDPNAGEGPYKGFTPVDGGNVADGYSVVFTEIIRDHILQFYPHLVYSDRPITNAEIATLGSMFRNELFGVAAHEILHAPGKAPAEVDHSELGIMRHSGGSITDFVAPETLLRVRRSRKWSDD